MLKSAWRFQALTRSSFALWGAIPRVPTFPAVRRAQALISSSLATLGAALLGLTSLGATFAQAQDATWLLNPGTSDWNTAANWNPATVPTGTATFDASNTTTLVINQANTQIGRLQFNAGAPAYTFNVTGTGGGASSLIIDGAGITNSSSNAPTFVVSGVAGNLGTLQFENSAAAGNAIITTNAFGTTLFTDTATGGTATVVTNVGGTFDISGLTSAGLTVGSIATVDG